MKLIQNFLTENECYKRNVRIKVKGAMLHSTGANNPYLKRYVQPNIEGIGVNKYNNHWNQYRPEGRQVCVHGFIGKLDNGDIATVQTLPWDMKGWHAGGDANGSYIGVEICEDNLSNTDYFNKVYKEAVELYAYLCKEFSLDPMTQIICHSEGYKKGIASNHSDVMHWFPKHGKSMDTFRADVKSHMEETVPQPQPQSQPTLAHKVGETVKINGVYTSSTSDKKLKPAVTTGTITKIIEGARNPYLLNNGNIGWVNDGCIASASAPVNNKKSNEEIADEVIKGLWGNGNDRKVRLTNAGYDYKAIQTIVNNKLR